jgi:hypothetical protein
MSAQAQIYPTTTHEIMNQSGPFVGVNVFACDRILNEAVTREAAGRVTGRASALGAAAGEAEWQEHAYLANRHEPVLKSHDRFGHRIDAVEFHPSIAPLMRKAFALRQCARHVVVVLNLKQLRREFDLVSFVAPGLKPRLQSAETSLGGNFSRLAKRHHSIDHQIHRSLSFLKCFSLSDCPQVR